MPLRITFTQSNSYSINDVKAHISTLTAKPIFAPKIIFRTMLKLYGNETNATDHSCDDHPENAIEEAFESIFDEAICVLSNECAESDPDFEHEDCFTTEAKPTPAPETPYEAKRKAILECECEEANLTRKSDALQAQIEALMAERLTIAQKQSEVSAEKIKAIIAKD